MKKLLWFWTFMFIALVAMMAYRGLKGVKNEEQVRGEETEFCDKMPEKDRKAADNALADEEAMQNSTHLRFKGVPIDGKRRFCEENESRQIQGGICAQRCGMPYW